ncbi:MAG TPA: HNH endonuclease signature motif containing protein [Longimicrobiales bacterium]|nr:HNH endonuclease signature motif containing protein [Longimicrobiales bacterium]
MGEPSSGEQFLPRRDRILRRDRFQCVYCNAQPPAAELTLDHVEPRIKGGDQSDGNLVTCCKACNTLKAGKPAWAFLANDAERREIFLRNATGVWPRLMRAIEQAARKTP